MNFSWQEYVLIGLSLFAVVIVIYTAIHVIREQAVLHQFLVNLKTEVGTDSGSTLAFRLEEQNKAMEVARLLAEERAKDWKIQYDNARAEREKLHMMIDKLEQMVQVLQIQQDLGRQLAEAKREAMEKGITLSVFQAGQAAQVGQTALGTEHTQSVTLP